MQDDALDAAVEAGFEEREAAVVDGDRGAPRELLGEREVALVVAALDRGEGERAADLAARDERHDDGRAIAERSHHRQVLGIRDRHQHVVGHVADENRASRPQDLRARVSAWDDGAWVREAALAHAAKRAAQPLAA